MELSEIIFLDNHILDFIGSSSQVVSAVSNKVKPSLATTRFRTLCFGSAQSFVQKPKTRNATSFSRKKNVQHFAAAEQNRIIGSDAGYA